MNIAEYNDLINNVSDAQQAEKNMYGCTEAFIDKMVTESSGRNISMFVASILSDAQECLASGNSERARQYMNTAKYILFEYTDCRSYSKPKKIID